MRSTDADSLLFPAEMLDIHFTPSAGKTQRVDIHNRTRGLS